MKPKNSESDETQDVECSQRKDEKQRRLDEKRWICKKLFGTDLINVCL